MIGEPARNKMAARLRRLKEQIEMTDEPKGRDANPAPITLMDVESFLGAGHGRLVITESDGVATLSITDDDGEYHTRFMMTPAQRKGLKEIL